MRLFPGHCKIVGALRAFHRSGQEWVLKEELATAASLAPGTVSVYMSTLVTLGLVEREAVYRHRVKYRIARIDGEEGG